MIAPGDTVAYSETFLRSLSCPPTDPMWLERGTVLEVKTNLRNCPPPRALVRWQDGHESPALVRYLTKT